MHVGKLLVTARRQLTRLPRLLPVNSEGAFRGAFQGGKPVLSRFCQGTRHLAGPSIPAGQGHARPQHRQCRSAQLFGATHVAGGHRHALPLRVGVLRFLAGHAVAELGGKVHGAHNFHHVRVAAVHVLDVVAVFWVHIDAGAVRPADGLVLFTHLAGEFGAGRVGGFNAADQGAVAVFPGTHVGVEQADAEPAGGVEALRQVGVDEGSAHAEAQAFDLFGAERIGVFSEPLGGVHGEVDDAGHLKAVVVLAGDFF